jgi:hypothetical protein
MLVFIIYAFLIGDIAFIFYNVYLYELYQQSHTTQHTTQHKTQQLFKN